MALLAPNHGHWSQLLPLLHLLLDALFFGRLLLLLLEKLGVSGVFRARLVPAGVCSRGVIIGSEDASTALILLFQVRLSRVIRYVTEIRLVIFASQVGVYWQKGRSVSLDSEGLLRPPGRPKLNVSRPERARDFI